MRRSFLLGLVALPVVLAGAAVGIALRRTPEEPLASDPEMREFAYSDGWIIQLSQ